MKFKIIKQQEKINKIKNLFYEKNSKIGKPLASQSTKKKKKGEKTYITNINKETISLQNVKKNQKNNYRNTMKNYHQI